MPNLKVTSLQNSSVLRKFDVLFVLMSILPMGVLYYIYWQIKEKGSLDLTESNLSVTLIFIVTGICIAFFIMRTQFKNLISITQMNRDTLKDVLGPDKLKELTQNDDEIAILARSFNEITMRLEENVRNLESAKKTLHSVLARVGRGLSSIQNIDSFLDLIVETVAEALSAKVGVLMLVDENSKDLFIKSVYGVAYNREKTYRMKIEKCPFSSIFQTKKPLLIPKIEGLEFTVPEQGAIFETPLLAAPLLMHDKVLGIISVSGKKNAGEFQEESMNLLFNLALQTAVAIENSRLSENAEKTYFETISALALAVEAKDQYSRGHLDRVAEYALKIAHKLNLSEEDINILRDGARLHDLGKIGILDEILKKPGSLSPQEWDIMKKHTEIGEGIIKPIRSLSKLSDVVRHHHEKLDGSGYPDGLKGDEISLLARILCVADIFDALTTDRPYRKALTFEEAKAELIKMKGKLDPKIVDTFLETLEKS